MTEVGTNLGVPSAVMSKIPADAGQIEIMRSDQLAAAQTAVRGVGVLDVWLAPFVLLIFAIAIYLARGFRRETLRNIGWAFVLVGLAVLVLRRLGGNYVINDLVVPANRPVMHDVWDVTTSILRSIGGGVLFYGVFAILLATLAGPTRPAVAHPALDRADAQPSPGDRVGRCRPALPAAHPVGSDRRAVPARLDPRLRGDPRLRRVRVAAPVAARVPRRDARQLQREPALDVGQAAGWRVTRGRRHRRHGADAPG